MRVNVCLHSYLLGCFVAVVVVVLIVQNRLLMITRLFSSIRVETARESTMFGNQSSWSNASTSRRHLDVSRYVVFSAHIRDSRGLGNQLFIFAMAVYAAKLSSRRPAIQTSSATIGLDEVFRLDGIERHVDLCPCHHFQEARALAYDRRIENVARAGNAEIWNASIFLVGYFQSWKYHRSVDAQLRHYFTFIPDIQRFVDAFCAQIVPAKWRNERFVRVGVHVRRGDVVSSYLARYGYSTPNATYFRNAMQYFVERHDRVQFVVCSNDWAWTRQNIAPEFFNRSNVNVTHVVGRSRAQDFAILARCDHVIISTGTFGWWAAWMARGTTVFYKNWPAVNSTLYRMFTFQEYFPPYWIPME